MRSFHGYESYRGRSTTRTVLKVIIVLLMVVLLAAVAAFFLLQKYLVYTDDGEARLELPFLQESEKPGPEPAPGDDPVVVVTGEPEPSDVPASTPAPAAEQLRPVPLYRTSLYDGTAATLVARGGGNAAWFNMKADDGTLGYLSALPEAAAMGTSAANANINAAIRELNAGELYTIARVSCFRDNIAPKREPAMGVKTDNQYNWRDDQDFRWLDPASAAARAYVTGVCRELAELGFDEIVLDYAGFPARGRTGSILRARPLTTAQMEQAVDGFYTQVEEALADFPQVRLSIAVSATVMAGENDGSGQTLKQVAEHALRICAPAPETGDYGAALAAADLSADRLLLTTAPVGFAFDPVAPALPPHCGGLLLDRPH